MDRTDNGLQSSTHKKEKIKQKKSFRFELSLKKSNDCGCPEFSYIDLLKDVTKVGFYKSMLCMNMFWIITMFLQVLVILL